MKHVLLGAMLLIGASSLQAQNFLDKMNAKLQGTAGPSKKQLKEAESDAASTVLDGKEFKKDSRGMNGIYFSTVPITAQTMGDNPATGQPVAKQVKKFLVEYDEAAYNLRIYTQYAYETTNETKLVKAAYWTSGSNPKSLTPEISIKAGGLLLADVDYDNRKYNFLGGFTAKKDLQGNYIQGDAIKTDWSSGKDLIEIEPGIILIGHLSIGKDGEENSLENNKKFKDMVVLYKAGKEDLAAKYTREYAWDKINEFWIKYKEASKATEAANTKLAAPFTGEVKDKPSDAVIKTAVEARMAQYKWGETYEYAYVTSNWKNEYKKLGVDQLNTLVSRSMQIQVVTKKGERCRSTIMYLTQENIFKTGSVEENFTGQPITVLSNAATDDIDCARAYEHKKS